MNRLQVGPIIWILIGVSLVISGLRGDTSTDLPDFTSTPEERANAKPPNKLLRITVIIGGIAAIIFGASQMVLSMK